MKTKNFISKFLSIPLGLFMLFIGYPWAFGIKYFTTNIKVHIEEGKRFLILESKTKKETYPIPKKFMNPGKSLNKFIKSKRKDFIK